ncbi:MAG: hypothetical protein D8H92_00800 [Campylobacter sp.]|nr:MAG: hypothetical protein D8H92_00800 [Campylobacter sp.]
MWLLKAEPLLILFLPTLKRLAAPRTVFILGILILLKFLLRLTRKSGIIPKIPLRNLNLIELAAKHKTNLQYNLENSLNFRFN